jgi:tetratricopeptide (TPR) repeat protein
LKGLEDGDVVELLAAAAGHDLDEDGVGLAHAVRRETDGNPFFTSELLRHLGESGGVFVGEDGRWAVAGELDEIGLPGSVRDVVGRRVARLGDEALRVLTLAAVIGREFDVDLLAELVDIDEDPLLDLMDAAVAAAILVESDAVCRYRFGHALIQHSLYDELSPTRRQRAHKRIAESLEAQTTPADAATLAELAHHWVAATRPTDADKALQYVRLAGDAARDALAPDDAIRWYRQALELIDRQTAPDQNERAALLAELGTAERLAARPEYRTTLFEAVDCARAVDNTDVLVRAALAVTHHAVGGSIGDEPAKAVLLSALERIGTDPTPQLARLLVELTKSHDAGTESEDRFRLARRAMEVARACGDDGTFLEATIGTHITLSTPDRRDQQVEDAKRAVSIADRSGDPDLRTRARFPMMWVRYQQADVKGLDATLAEMGSIAEGAGLPYARMEHTMFRTGRLLLAGDADGADASNQRMLELGLAAEIPETLPTFGGLLYSIRHQQGRLDEIADYFIDAARDNPSIAALRSSVMLMLCELERVDEARARLAAESATGSDYPYDIVWLAAMSNLIDVAVTCGDHDAAQSISERVIPFAHHVVSPSGAMTNGAVARPLARCATLLGDYDQADEWFAVAHDIHERLQAPFWTALGQLDHADLCLARRADGDIERARELITTAAATAAEYGCAGLTRRAEVLLAES